MTQPASSPRHRGRFTLQQIKRVVSLLVGLFFRRITIQGTENLPTDRGGILVSWHPNGLVDPGLIFHACPRKVVFGARHGLFKIPLLSALMRAAGAVPVYRAVDMGKASDTARQSGNQSMFDALSGAMASGAFAALFPEGVSHDAPHLVELKTGAARIYYQTRTSQPDAPTPAIIPVGLHYQRKRIFRSDVLIEFHPPIELPPALDVTPPAHESRDALRERARDLTEEIERVLSDVIHATESWDVHFLMHRARALVRAERGYRAGAKQKRARLSERVLGFARIWTGYETRAKTHPAEVETLMSRVEQYDADLRALGLSDREIDRSPRLASIWLPVILVLQAITVFLLFPPFLVVGYVVNLPAALVLELVVRQLAQEKKDIATLKLLFGALIFPLAWLAFGLLGWWGHDHLIGYFPTLPTTPILSGLVCGLMGPLGGAVAVRYLRVGRETARGLRVRFTRKLRRRTLSRLRSERSALCDAILGLAQGLDLPGEVDIDGRIIPTPSED